MDARADRLRERLLRGPALGEVPRLVLGPVEARALLRGEDAVDEPLAVALEHLANAIDRHDVGSDPDDHRAPVMSAFISRTASRSPTNTARLTIAWPMCSSRMPGSAATGSTLW